MRIGLALSGGGFRATLYHLGVIRFLRDSDLLRNVSHITSVSGGSILAAHLALNWERYCGTAEEFEQAAQQILTFVDLDIRNRIVRRYPLLVGQVLYSIILRRDRLPTRTRLLERYYQQYLYGDLCCHQLPVTPELHILCTNVGGGGLSSFNREGLLVQQRSSDGKLYFKAYRAGLAKVATAVAASSAFPGFFPPIDVQPQDIGALEGDFSTHYFTDGAVYDNLGIRMFHYLGFEKDTRFRTEDFLDLDTSLAVWTQCLQQEKRTSLRRLAEIAKTLNESGEPPSNPSLKDPQPFLETLDRLLHHSRLQEDPEFLALLGHSRVESATLQQTQSQTNEPLSNRQYIAAAFKQVTGQDCLKSRTGVCDAILVSDAGRIWTVNRPGKPQGFLSTALRSSDILLDRVLQLERQNFAHEHQFNFMSLSDIVSEVSDPTVLHPEIQAQLGRIRTDLNRFHPFEISPLVQQGYCVARQTCRSLPPAISDQIAPGSPWDPVQPVKDSDRPTTADLLHRDPVTTAARALQDSTNRHIFRSLLDLRDWFTWLYIPVLLLLLVGMPWFTYRTYRNAQLYSVLTQTLAQMRGDFGKMLELLQYGPPTEFTATPFEEVNQLGASLKDTGFNIVVDTRITDLREWLSRSKSPTRRVYVYRQVVLRKISKTAKTVSLQLQSPWDTGDLAIHYETTTLNPTLRRYNTAPNGDPQGPFIWEIGLDVSEVEVDELIELTVNIMQTVPRGDRRFTETEWWQFDVDSQPEIITSWILLPSDQTPDSFTVVRTSDKTPDKAELVDPARSMLMEAGSVIYWSVVQPDSNYTYSSRWHSD